MLTPRQRSSLGTYTCPTCGRPLGRFHAYPVEFSTLISRLTESVPMHQECAEQYHMVGGGELTAVWIVKSSSPSAPSGKIFEPTKGDMWIHLFTPERIDIRHSDRPATYAEIEEAMMPAIKPAMEAATSDEEIETLTKQIAWLHRFLPPRPQPVSTAQ